MGSRAAQQSLHSKMND